VISSENDLVDMGQDLQTPAKAIIAYTESLLDYAKHRPDWAEFIPDLNKMLSAAQQLSALITKLFTKRNTPSGEVDLESFTSTIRHDLRTPINAIIGYGEMLLEDVDDEVNQEACLELQKTLSSARRLLTLIGDLIYFSKAETVSRQLEPESAPSVPVSTLMDEVVRSMRSTTDNHVAEVAIQEASLLVVDDKESNRDLLSRRLDRQGFKVEVAENGQQALDMIRQRSYDLVLLDIIMPEMNGYQVLAELKKDQHLSHIPVIMISALDEIDSVVRCIEMGAEDYLQKPFNQVILKAKISASLERKRLRDREHAFIKKLQIEQDKSEKLLLNILPKPIADRLKRGERVIADSFPEVTVLFSDLVGFTQLSAGVSASQLVEKLNEIFLAFDILTELHGLEKIKTIGDAYMLVGGLPTPRLDHAEAVADMAMDMFDAIKRLNFQHDSNFNIRVGIHTGPVVAGVIGKNKFNYDLWGDAVNIASRMESHGIPGNIQISEATYKRIQDKFNCESRGLIDIKGKGQMHTYFLKGRK
jgi:class 3 adenylate cyclase